MIIQTIYSVLSKLDLIESRGQFSQDYLGRSGRYFDYLCSAQAAPSLAALTTLAMRISGLADIFREYEQKARQTKLFDALADRVWTEVEHRTYTDAWKTRHEGATSADQGASRSALQS